MRISSSAIYDTNVNMLNQQQGKLLHTQQQLASGRRMLTPADDPFASARALEVSQSDSANTQFVTNRNAAKHSTAMAESILQSVTSLLQDVRTATVGDGSGVLTKSDKMSLATDLRGRYEELIGLANSTDGLGNYLFSGYQGRTMPFVKDSGGIQYVADDGQRMIQVDNSRQLATSDSGADIFMRIKNGNGKFTVDASPSNTGSGIYSQGTFTNPAQLTGHKYKIVFNVEENGGEKKTSYDVVDQTTEKVLSKDNRYTSGQLIDFDGVQLDITGEPAKGDEFYVAPSGNESVFKTLSDLINALHAENPLGGSTAKAQFTNSVNRALNNIDRSMENVSTIRTSLGSRLREIDALQTTGEDVGLQYKAKLSELQDVDFNKAVSDLNQEQTSLTAAQKSFKQVSDLSLFNYL
ncbi:MAG: flagellar hook-associated protein 3 [Gallionellales bacterium 35-53-114]|jgi:flagellar hook-associated protein 3 FlgL|nr:MAG: flagellar hook-associated protein 3 [Gallionellales bacterium 35-53-114]OYZ64222.1 MAG: flagellar hook-associated protein 3 [Gallionellales bacterium 24-53-125]OZB10468.1 MAG: flagellar hook-associated protein 3 [Gallionellales bacterium 39-52-133]HQS57086.1 flagellar hook-associated protein FlgL [Gallionellaceae bacterium]HQS74726.1 flagellar hook-associated protein FlgL [Gallionellaceae bacterium]